MEANSLKNKEILYNQIEEEYGKVVYTYTTQIIHAGKLYKQNRVLKCCQLLLSAVSTGGFIGTLITNQTMLIWIGGLCSTILLFLTAYFKEFDISSLHNQHLNTSNQLWLLREQYLSLLVDFDSFSKDEIIERRNKLQAQLAEVYKCAPITSEKSYKKAQQVLKENEYQFFSRDELNKILPESLRKKNQ